MSKNSVDELIKQFSRTSSDELRVILDQIKELVSTEDADEGAVLQEFAVQSAYQGYDPKLVAFIVISIRNDDIENRRHDIEKMVIIAIERGNNVESIKKNSTAEFLEQVKRLVSTYNIKPKAGQSRSNITFSRVAMSFPIYTCEYMTAAKSPTVPHSLIDALVPSYPRYMMTSAFASMIPRTGEQYTYDLLYAHCIHQLEFTKIVSKKSPQPEEDMVADVMKYSDAAINGSYLTKEVQLSRLISWGLVAKAKGGLIQATQKVKDAANQWKTKYKIA